MPGMADCRWPWQKRSRQPEPARVAAADVRATTFYKPRELLEADNGGQQLALLC